jgi:arylsulfatase A-like enzyme
MLWTIPTADAVIFGTLGLAIALARTRWRGNRFTQIALILSLAGSAYALLLNYLTLQWIARLVLSLGAGIQLGLYLAGHTDAFRRFLRVATVPAVCLVALTAFILRAKDVVAERRAYAALGPPPAGAPNVLVVVLDAVRASDLSLYGYARPTTPHLALLAASSVVFDNAISTAPWTLPSHASIFTAHYPHEMSADWEVPLDARYPTLAEILRDHGYSTGGFVANQLYGVRELGLSRGFVRYVSRRLNFGGVMETSRLSAHMVVRFNRLTHRYTRPGRRNAADINKNLLDWLPKRGERPFFAFVNYFDAHEPYAPPAPFGMKFLRSEPPTRRSRNQRLTKAEIQGMRDAYDGGIAYEDSQLDVLLRELERRGQLSNTLVVITADHGEEFGEHGWVSHGNGLNLPVLHVPLLIRFPGRVPAGFRVGKRVTLRDLPTTVLNLLGIAPRVEMPGRSLAINWRTPADSSQQEESPILSEVNRPRNTPDWYAVARGTMQSIIVGRHHFIRNGDGREELYDIVSDPWETADLARSPSDSASLATSRAALKAALSIGSFVSGTKPR